MTCEYFALCDHEAAGYTWHPVLSYVPTCERCAARFDLELLTAAERDALDAEAEHDGMGAL